METGTIMMSIVIAINLIILVMIAAFWYQFKDAQKNYWQNRHTKNSDHSKSPLFPSFKKNHSGPRIKPKVKSDAELFEIEQKPRSV